MISIVNSQPPDRPVIDLATTSESLPNMFHGPKSAGHPYQPTIL